MQFKLSFYFFMVLIFSSSSLLCKKNAANNYVTDNVKSDCIYFIAQLDKEMVSKPVFKALVSRLLAEATREHNIDRAKDYLIEASTIAASLKDDWDRYDIIGDVAVMQYELFGIDEALATVDKLTNANHRLMAIYRIISDQWRKTEKGEKDGRSYSERLDEYRNKFLSKLVKVADKYQKHICLEYNLYAIIADKYISSSVEEKDYEKSIKIAHKIRDFRTREEVLSIMIGQYPAKINRLINKVRSQMSIKDFDFSLSKWQVIEDKICNLTLIKDSHQRREIADTIMPELLSFEDADPSKKEQAVLLINKCKSDADNCGWYTEDIYRDYYKYQKMASRAKKILEEQGAEKAIEFVSKIDNHIPAAHVYVELKKKCENKRD